MIKITNKDPKKYTGDLVVYFVLQSEKKTASFQDDEIARAAREVWKTGDFIGKENESFLVYPRILSKKQGAGFRAERLLVVGLGSLRESEAEKREQLRIGAGVAVNRAIELRAGEMIVVLPDFLKLKPEIVAESIVEGLILGNYRFLKYKKSQEDNGPKQPVEKIMIHGGGMSNSPVRRGCAKGEKAANACVEARNMANEPGNMWTADNFVDFGRKLSQKYGMQCKIIDKAEMKKLGMGGILSVNQGSASEPKLVVIEYRTNKKNPTLMLAGKGLTFDSGGISLKPSASMEKMKYDMCGGAAVLCAMQVIGFEKPRNINVVAVVPTTDNMPGAKAMKPGDIITHYNGKTVEVINTDAEGRLILADALSYGVDTYKPDAIIDLATLTGACVIGLGHHYTGLLSNNNDLAESLVRAGELSAEPIWRFPLGKEYTKQLKSEIADLKNVGGRPGGTITAAAYLEHFVNNTPWAHLDLAGTAWDFTEKSYVPKGPSGIGVRTLVYLVRNWHSIKK